MTKALLLSDPTDLNLADQLRAVLSNEPVDWELQPAALPALWEQVVILFVMTPQSVANSPLTQFVEDAIRRGLPVVPVVEDLAGFSFRQRPVGLAGLKRLNALDFSDAGARIIRAVRGYLGLFSFARHQKVFLSYKRSDGELVATSIRDYLKAKGFQVFHDIESLEGGEVVQDSIREQLHEKDFVLLIESPAVAESDWVAQEIIEAQSKRIPVRVVSLPDTKPHFVPDAQRVEWDPNHPRNLERILLMVSRAIAQRESLDSRVLRVALEAATAHGARVASNGSHSIVLQKGTSELILEYECANVSLERLHRLSRNTQTRGAACRAALICGDSTIAPSTCDAAIWACRSEPLEVLALPDLTAVIARCFQ